MELYVFCLLGVMILTTVVLKGIFCWLHYSNPAPWEKEMFKKKKKKRKKQVSSPPKNLVQMEIPMEDIERTSTPVPFEEKQRSRPDFHSDV